MDVSLINRCDNLHEIRDVFTLDPGMTFAAALTALGFTASNGEAKRKAAEGAIKLDGETIDDALAPARAGRISLGKKRHGVLV